MLVTTRVRAPLLTAVWLAAVAHAAAAGQPVTRVAMLPLTDRTTVVLELGQPPARVEEIQADATSVVVEAGPFTDPIQPQELTPAARSAFVSAVSISRVLRPDGTAYVRMRIAISGEPSHHLRRSGTRVYVDFSARAIPRAEPVVGARPVGRLELIEGARPVARPERVEGPAPKAPETTQAKPPQAEAIPAAADPEAAYRALENSVLARARQMAARPDVKGLLRLRDEIERRDKELGHRRPDAVEKLIIDLLRHTDEARALQLERDRQTFLKKQ